MKIRSWNKANDNTHLTTGSLFAGIFIIEKADVIKKKKKTEQKQDNLLFINMLIDV